MVVSRRHLAGWIGLGVLGITLFTARPGTAAEATGRIYVTINKSKVINLLQRVSQVSVVNPAIADVTVITPEELLISGRAVGTTSLTVFQGNTVGYFDVIVQPGPVVDIEVNDAVEPHSVLVHRADRTTNQTFVRDKGDESWVELGTVRPATEGKK